MTPSKGSPPWFSLVLGGAALAVGLYVLLRPFASIRVLMILVAVGLVVHGIARTREPQTAARVTGWVTVAGGFAVVLWPSSSVRILLFVVAGWLVIDGAIELWNGWRGPSETPAALIMAGTASIIFGLLTLLWPDISLIAIAVIFAIKLIAFGLSRISGVLRPRPSVDERRRSVTLAALSLLVALLLGWASFAMRSGAPTVDAFYDPPDSIPTTPGSLLRHEPFTRGIPSGAVAWRILYTTTREDSVPALASALVVAPENLSSRDAPVIAWAHGTTGVDRTCAPSVLADPFGSGAFYLVDKVVDQGWVLVATDYIGLGTASPHPYLIGQGEGRSVLDAIRAGRHLPDLVVGDENVIWGHSQGGHAALWTGVLASEYAPELEVLGVASLAPASDLPELVGILEETPGGNVFASFTATAYSQHYPEVDLGDYVEPSGQVTLRALSSRCLSEPAVFTSLLSSLAVNWSMFTGDINSGPMGTRLVENTPPFTIDMPLLLAQGGADSLILKEMQDGYVQKMCQAGQDVDYRVYPGRNHIPLVEPDSPLIPELLAWTRARLAGDPPASSC